MEFMIALAFAEIEVCELKSKPPDAFPWSWQLIQLACMIGKTSLAYEMVLHCTSSGITFSLVQEKRAIEQEEKEMRPAIKRSVAFIYFLTCFVQGFQN